MKSTIQPPEMIRAFLDGRKTMFRMPCKPSCYQQKYARHDWMKEPAPQEWNQMAGMAANVLITQNDYSLSPYLPGETIYVKENFSAWFKTHEWIGHWYDFNPENRKHENCNNLFYRATHYYPDDDQRWIPPLYMPEWASRFKLKILTTGAEQVQAITEENCFKEGIKNICINDPIASATWSPIPDFIYYWDTRFAHKPEYQWERNPWVWVFGCEMR